MRDDDWSYRRHARSLGVFHVERRTVRIRLRKGSPAVARNACRSTCRRGQRPAGGDDPGVRGHLEESRILAR